MSEQEITTYDKGSVVKLFKVVVTREGNLLNPGIYGPFNPLPEKYMTAEYVELVEGQAKPKVKLSPEDSQLQATRDELKPKDLTIKAKDDQSYEVKAQEVQPDYIPALNINEANVDQLVALNGIGKNIAKKVIELRELFPFSNHSELNERVPLAFGRNWSDYSLEFGEE